MKGLTTCCYTGIYFITFVACISKNVQAEMDFDWNEGEQDESGGLIQMESVLGRIATLPCDIESSVREHRVYMVLWFKESSGKPLYSFDVRGRQFKKALHWSDNNTFGPRATFVTNIRPAYLKIDSVQLSDEGIYRCRVDFKDAPSRNYQIKLIVIVPPYQIIIYDSSGREVNSVVGPLTENADLHLTCEVRGGKPSPAVHWYNRNHLMESTTVEVPESENSRIVTSRLDITGITRHQHNSTYSCQASNTDLITPQKKTVTLQLYLQLISVRIIRTSLPKYFSVNQEYKFQCEVIGSTPDPKVAWFEDGTQLHKSPRISEFKSNNTVVLSELVYTLQANNNGHVLKCSASNPVLMNSSLEDSIVLNVRFAPIVSLQLGNTLDPNNIKEGDDVYFECRVRSNPVQHRIFWYHNDLPVVQKVSSGIILSTKSLVLQGVSYKDSGKYSCQASNEMGETMSSPVHLRVKYAPRCSHNDSSVIGASLEEILRIICNVLADPVNASFSWQFNNTLGESLKVDPTIHYTFNQTASQLIYRISSEMDYGTLICWADNEIGRQIEPCIFRIIPAAKPSRLQNCTLDIINGGREEESWLLKVDCIPGNSDGSLRQLYHLDVVHSNTLLLNLTNHIPTFYINMSLLNIVELSFLQVYVYSTNVKGKSEITLLMGNSSRNAEKRTEWVKTQEMNKPSGRLSTVLASSLVAVSVIVVLFVAVLIQL